MRSSSSLQLICCDHAVPYFLLGKVSVSGVVIVVQESFAPDFPEKESAIRCYYEEEAGRVHSFSIVVGPYFEEG